MAKSVYDLEEELKLKQWCIEQAIRWPGGSLHNYNMGSCPPEINILERAEHIYNWVTK